MAKLHEIDLKAKPNAELVHILETLLAEALEGTLQGAAFVLLKDPSTVSTGWAGIIAKNPVHTLGGVSLLEARLVDLVKEKM